MADGLCITTAQLDSELADGREALEEPADSWGSSSTDYYLTFVGSTVPSLATALRELPDSGVEAADRYVTSLADEVGRVAPEVERLAGESWEVSQLTEQERRTRVTQIVELLESIDPEGPDLRTLVRETAEFAAFYELAPNCAPLDPPPPPSTSTPPPPPNKSPDEAEDGTDLAACADGDCEVAITDSATVTVGEYTIDVTVADGQVTTMEEFPGGGSGSTVLGGVGGASSFGQVGGTTVTMTLNGLTGTTAVMEFSTN
jgi:hypothetical protein